MEIPPSGSRIGYWPPRSHSSTSVLSTSPQSVESSNSSVRALLRSSCEPNIWHEQLSYAVNVIYSKDTANGRLYAKRLLLEGFPPTSLTQSLRVVLPQNSVPVESLEVLSQKIDGLYEMRLHYYEEKSQWKTLLIRLIDEKKLTEEQAHRLPNHYKRELSLNELPATFKYWGFLSEYTFDENYISK